MCPEEDGILVLTGAGGGGVCVFLLVLAGLAAKVAGKDLSSCSKGPLNCSMATAVGAQ